MGCTQPPRKQKGSKSKPKAELPNGGQGNESPNQQPISSNVADQQNNGNNYFQEGNNDPPLLDRSHDQYQSNNQSPNCNEMQMSSKSIKKFQSNLYGTQELPNRDDDEVPEDSVVNLCPSNCNDQTQIEVCLNF